MVDRGVSESQFGKFKLGFVNEAFVPDPVYDQGHNKFCLQKSSVGLWCDTCRFIKWSSTWENGTQFVGKRLVDSIVLPLISYSGVYVGFQIRSLQEKLYDTFALVRRPEAYFFGSTAAFESIWAQKVVSLVEGPFDALIIDRLVTKNVLGLTTSSINQLQLKFLERFVNQVNLILDGDLAGHSGSKKFIDLNSGKFVIKLVKIKPSDKDPNQLWRTIGDDKFIKYFSEQLSM
jgi:5S rRNA maturation endonuclease (ribonuclease M5)